MAKSVQKTKPHPSAVQTSMLASSAARQAVDTALAAAEKRGVKVCVVVLDAAARMLAAQCMDGVTNASFEVALAKARHSANFRRPTKFQQDLLLDGKLQILGIPGMIPLEGGLPIELDGLMIGAVGVSGAASNIDVEIAEEAIRSLGL